MTGGLRDSGEIPLTRLGTADLTPADLDAIRALLDTAFADDGDGFTDEDWQHAAGGTHLIARLDGSVVGHAAVVPRSIRIGDRTVRAGYVEAVATRPDRQGRGIGTHLMRAAGDVIEEEYELGVLSTGAHAFYARLGWLPWAGHSHVRTPTGTRPTPEDDGSLMVLPTRHLPAPDPTDDIECEWRPGEVW